MKKVFCLIVALLLTALVITEICLLINKPNTKIEVQSQKVQNLVINEIIEENIIEELPNGVEIEVIPEEEVGEEEIPQEEIKMYTTSKVNIREGAGTDFNILKTVDPNYEVIKIGDEEDWSIILDEDNICYIKTSLLSNTKVEIKSVVNVETLGVYTLTGYCPCAQCCGKTNGITASGAKATSNHTIAAPSNFKFGTQIEINGIVYTVEDRGGAIKGNRLDVYFDTHQEALNFGKRKAEIKILN